MTSVGAADRSDRAGVARCREPVVNRGPDAAALNRRFSRTVMASDQKDNSLAPADGLLKPAIDCVPRGIEGQAVKIEDTVRLDRAGTKAAIPARVQSTPEPARSARQLPGL